MFAIRKFDKTAKKLPTIKYESDETVRLALLELIIYIVFLIVATIVANSVQHLYMFYFNQTIQKLFLNREIETKYGKEVDFKNIVTTSDWWSYLEGNFLDGLHGENGNDTKSRKLLRDNILLGPPRLRQIRVKPNSCEINDAFRRYFNTCYTEYSHSAEDKQNSYKGTHYYSKGKLGAIAIRGEMGYYYGGGYVQSLSYERKVNEEILERLKNIKWIDRGTRLILLEFVLFNSNAYMFENVKILAELPPVGGIITSYQLQALKFSLWMEKDVLLYIAASVFFLMAFLYTIEEVIEIKVSGYRIYFSSVWNAMDLIVLLLVYLSFIYNIISPLFLRRLLNIIKKDQNEFLSIDRMCYWNRLYIDMMAICIFLIWLKVFKFISFNKTMLHFCTTLSRCAKDLFGFAVMFFIVFLAYAELGLLLFGSTHPDFRNFGVSIITLMRMFLGDFEYELLERANYVLGPIYFISYVVLVFFILLNMFLAIVNDTYVVVKSEITRGQSRLGAYIIELFRKYVRAIRKCCRRRKEDQDEMEIVNLKLSETKPTSSEKSSYPPSSTSVTTPRTPLRLTGVLKEYFEEIPPDGAKADQKDDRRESMAYNEIGRLANRVQLLEDILEQLISNMDRILRKVDSKKRNKKD